MAFTYRPIDYQPLDFSGLEQIPLAYQKAQRAKADREHIANEDRKISADIARGKWEQERADKKDAETTARDAAGMLAPGSMLRRAIDSNDPSASAIGKAYGIDVEQPDSSKDLIEPAFMRDVQPEPDAQSGNIAQWLQGGARPISGKEALDASSYGPPSPDAPDAPAPDLNLDEEIAARSPDATTRPWSALVNGQRFNIPKNESKPFGDPEYDGLYNRFISQGNTPQQAEAKVLQIRGQNLGAAGRGARLDQQALTQLTREEQLKKAADALAQSGKNAQTAASARLGAASITAGMPHGGGRASPDGEVDAPMAPAMGKAEAAALNALNQRATQIRMNNGWTKLVEMDHTAEMLLKDVENGAVPLQNREAQVLAAKIIRGRVTNEEMHQLYDNLGGASDALSRLAHNVGLGELSPEQLGQLRSSVNVILNAHKTALEHAKQAVRVGFGKATFGRMAPQAQEMANEMFASIGADPEDLYGPQPSTPEATPPRPAQQAAAPAAPPSPQRQLPPTMTTPDGKVHTLGPDGKYH